MEQAGIRARGLVKRFGPTSVLDGLDLDAPPGVVTAVVGPNGSGKTTLLRIVATLIRPDAGSVTVDGRDVVRDGDAVRRVIGVALANDRAMYWRLSGVENLAFFARAAGLDRARALRAAEGALDDVGLSAIASARVATYSTGQRQRLLLARATLADPAVLLIDEPMRGLDEDGRARVGSLLRARADRGATVVVATPMDVDVSADVVVGLGAERAAVRA